MQWQLKWEGQEAFLQEVAETTGITPPGLQSKPQLDPEAAPLGEMFLLLNGSRTYGFSGPNPLQVGEIKAMLDMVGEDDVERRLFILWVIKQMDTLYLNHVESKRDTSTH